MRNVRRLRPRMYFHRKPSQKTHLRHIYDEGRTLVAGAVGYVGDQVFSLLGQAHEILGGGGEELTSLFFIQLGGRWELNYNHF